MRFRVLSIALLTVAAAATFSLTRGQDRTPRKVASEKNPSASSLATRHSPLATSSEPLATPVDFSKLGVLQKEMLGSCQRGADWLFRVNGLKGRFLNGYLPALKTEMEGGNYLRQAGAACALARAARFLGEERYAARATQAILGLLDETVIDSNDPSCRHNALPSMVVNRLAAAGLLVLAINELPAPQADLLMKSEQLCNWIRRQARADGSLRTNDAPPPSPPAREGGEGGAQTEDADHINQYTGLALYAVLRSQKHRPADWKAQLVRKAAAYYRPWWKAHRSMAFVPWHTAAYAEAYQRSKDAAFADFVYEMNDWLCRAQYDHLDPHRLAWYGGFMSWTDDKAVDSPPTIVSARYAESLAEARRVARLGSDPTRHQRYTEAAERCLQFVVRLQYTDANTQHFADWYRPRLVGAFHASFQDGNLRIDYAEHAISALIAYLLETSRSG